MAQLTEDPIVRPKEAARLLGITRRTLYAWVERGLLPPPISLGPRAMGYRQSTIQTYLDSRAGASL